MKKFMKVLLIAVVAVMLIGSFALANPWENVAVGSGSQVETFVEKLGYALPEKLTWD